MSLVWTFTACPGSLTASGFSCVSKVAVSAHGLNGHCWFLAVFVLEFPSLAEGGCHCALACSTLQTSALLTLRPGP